MITLDDYISSLNSDNEFLIGTLDTAFEGAGGADKKLILLALVYALDAKLVYEVGVNYGGTAAVMCRGLQTTGGRYVGFELKEALKPVEAGLIERFGVPVEIVWGDSALTVPKRLAETGERPDLFFVDGGHTPEQFKTDLNNALACVRPGGFIFMDDIEALKPYALEIIPESEVLWFVGSAVNGPGSALYQKK